MTTLNADEISEAYERYRNKKHCEDDLKLLRKFADILEKNAPKDHKYNFRKMFLRRYVICA